MKNFLPAILVPLSVLLAGCNTWILENPDPGEPCVNIDPAAMPGGIWLGMKPKDARRILGDPLREVLLDFTGSGSSLTRLRYEGFMLESSDRAGNKIGLFEWTKPGTGPNSELLLGGPEPRIPHHTIVYRWAMDGSRSEEIPTVAGCRRPDQPRLRIVYFVKDGKIDSVDARTWTYPY